MQNQESFTAGCQAGADTATVLSHNRNDTDARAGLQCRNRIWEVAMKELVHCRAMESLYRQGAALHPEDSWKLLAEAEKWRHKALDQIASHFQECNVAAPAGPEALRLVA
jgi:hypothetical protein